MTKASFVLYVDMYEPIRDLTLAQKGALLDAIFAYHANGEPQKIDDVAVNIAFKFLKNAFDRDAAIAAGVKNP